MKRTGQYILIRAFEKQNVPFTRPCGRVTIPPSNSRPYRLLFDRTPTYCLKLIGASARKALQYGNKVVLPCTPCLNFTPFHRPCPRIMKCSSLEPLNEIIGHIPQAGRKLLTRCCSLVAGPLTYPCEKRLLRTSDYPPEPTSWWKLNTGLTQNVEVFS